MQDSYLQEGQGLQQKKETAGLDFHLAKKEIATFWEPCLILLDIAGPVTSKVPPHNKVFHS